MKNYRYLADVAYVRLVDSFVKDNKAGAGSGEACIYMGNKSDREIFDFFGDENFDIHCTIFKEDLIDYMEKVKFEYITHRFVYRNQVDINTWNEKLEEIQSLPDELSFDLTRKRQNDRTGRVYAQELSYKGGGKNLTLEKAPKAYAYNLIRRIAIPVVSFLMITKTGDNISADYQAALCYDPDFLSE